MDTIFSVMPKGISQNLLYKQIYFRGLLSLKKAPFRDFLVPCKINAIRRGELIKTVFYWDCNKTSGDKKPSHDNK